MAIILLLAISSCTIEKPIYLSKTWIRLQTCKEKVELKRLGMGLDDIDLVLDRSMTRYQQWISKHPNRIKVMERLIRYPRTDIREWIKCECDEQYRVD